MSFEEEVYLAMIDSLLIGAILAVAGYWLNRRLEAFKSDEEYRRQVAIDRVVAYKQLFALMEPLSPTSAEVMTNDRRTALGERLRTWYYENGLYLPLEISKLFLEKKDLLLRGDTVSDEQLRDEFSSLRTSLKVDAGVYNTAQGAMQI